MKVRDFDALLGNLGVHRREWRERIVAEVAVMIGDAQVRSFVYGMIFATFLGLVGNWVMVNP